MSKARRDFIKQAGAGVLGTFLTPFERFADSVVLGFVQRAYAQETNTLGSRFYVNFFFPGGPHRVVFDQWLRTNAADPAVLYNPMMATAFTASGGRNTGFEYRTFTAPNGLLVPHLFSQAVTTSSGTKALSSILNNMLTIRGFSTGLDGHGLNANIQQFPMSGAPSMLALTADVSKAPYSAVRYNAGGPWSSLTGKAVSSVGADNPLQQLFESLRPSTADLQKVKSIKDRNIAAFDRADAQLKLLSASDNLGSKALRSSLDSARTILKRGIGNIDGYWGEAVGRYSTSVLAAARTSNIPGISDLQTNPNSSVMWRVGIDSPGSITRMADPNSDMRNIFANVQVPGMAENFALIEYLVSEGYTSSIGVNQGLPSGFTLGGTVPSDMHFTGAGPALLVMNSFYRALLAGVLELRDKLSQKTVGGQNAWAQTVLHFSADFPRSANMDGGGSEHGFSQNVNSVISGAFTNGPFCVGNIERGTADAGTTGVAAALTNYPIAGLPGMPFAASHVATVLGLAKNPFGNVAPPVVQLVGSNLTTSMPGKIVG